MKARPYQAPVSIELVKRIAPLINWTSTHSLDLPRHQAVVLQAVGRALYTITRAALATWREENVMATVTMRRMKYRLEQARLRLNNLT